MDPYIRCKRGHGNLCTKYLANKVHLEDSDEDGSGINQEVVRKFAILLRALSSGYEIDVEEFEKYALDTAQLYNIAHYNWNYMSASVHKILLHGASVIKYCILPIGQLSEDAQESRNKDCKFFREHHSHKSSRIHSNEDLIHRLLVTSDPVISSIRTHPTRKGDALSPEVSALLKCSAISISHFTTANSSDSDDHRLKQL